MKSNNTNNQDLRELGGSDYEIEDGQPNIKGWEVKDEAGRKIGKVKELLFNESSRKVRYIILNLKDNAYDLESREVLIPIGIASLHQKDDDVLLPGVDASMLQALPEYEEDSVTADVERTIRNVFEGTGGAALAGTAFASANDDDFYSHQHFNEDNLYKNRNSESDSAESIPVIREEINVGKRDVETGGLRLRSRVVETPFEKNITLKEEIVNIERTPVDRLATDSDQRHESIEMSTREEVPVVSKEARIVEEVSLRKTVTEREEIISDTLKDTEVNVENIPASKNKDADLL